jgi:hypothetical protein
VIGTSLESESVSIAMVSLSFTSLSLTGFHFLVFFHDNVILIFKQHLVTLSGHHQEHITLHHPFPQFPQLEHKHFIGVTELCLFFILFFLWQQILSKI